MQTQDKAILDNILNSLDLVPDLNFHLKQSDYIQASNQALNALQVVNGLSNKLKLCSISLLEKNQFFHAGFWYNHVLAVRVELNNQLAEIIASGELSENEVFKMSYHLRNSIDRVLKMINQKNVFWF